MQLNTAVDEHLPTEIRDYMLAKLIQYDLGQHQFCPSCDTFWSVDADGMHIHRDGRAPYALFNVGLRDVDITFTGQPHTIQIWYIRYQIIAPDGTYFQDRQIEGETMGLVKGKILDYAIEALADLQVDLSELEIADVANIFWDSTLEYSYD